MGGETVALCVSLAGASGANYDGVLSGAATLLWSNVAVVKSWGRRAVLWPRTPGDHRSGNLPNCLSFVLIFFSATVSAAGLRAFTPCSFVGFFSFFVFFFYRAGKCRTSEVNRLGRRQTLLLVWEAFTLNTEKKRKAKKVFPSRYSLRDDADAAPPLVFSPSLQLRCVSDRKKTLSGFIFLKVCAIVAPDSDHDDFITAKCWAVGLKLYKLSHLAAVEEGIPEHSLWFPPICLPFLSFSSSLFQLIKC